MASGYVTSVPIVLCSSFRFDGSSLPNSTASNFRFFSCFGLRSLGTRLYTIISKTSLVGEWYNHYCESQTTEYCGADGFTVIGMHLVCSWGCRPHSSNRSVFEGKSWCSPVSLCCDWLLLHGCSRQVVAYLNVGLFTCQQETVLHWTLSW